MKKGDFCFLGQQKDTNNRVKLRRVDDENHRTRVNEARNAIFRDGRPVGGVHVQRLLKERSEVPIEVGYNLFVRYN